jgi:ATP-binding protein involved in chromosome partitioning
MSFGFVASQPATMRGPMASSIVSKLLLNTEWGSLDYLIVDTPPGTGDINLSLC